MSFLRCFFADSVAATVILRPAEAHRRTALLPVMPSLDNPGNRAGFIPGTGSLSMQRCESMRLWPMVSCPTPCLPLPGVVLPPFQKSEICAFS